MLPLFWIVEIALLFVAAHGLIIPHGGVHLERRVVMSESDINNKFQLMAKHIFEGEDKDKGSGRHMLRVWCKGNPKSRGICHKETHLCYFSKNAKTVWDDRANMFTEKEVEKMCKEAIKLNHLGVTTVKTTSFILNAKFGNICVTHLTSGTGSCYPDGINPGDVLVNKRGSPLAVGEACPSGTGLDIKKSKFEEAVKCEEVNKSEEKEEK
ncbi:unnamed protein product [Cyclocybe aegerita]|uniref:Uncharacterized protein n=1 Tax=Cyclocybe aegerita TaxID=1973307 RepID=A0A8S0XQI5_CYCAE|nr:unnamed protein product [Cyclocybe aegerita]